MTEPTIRQKATLWLAIVFVLGAALGGVLGYAFAHRGYAAEPAVLSAQARRVQRREKLTHDVGLNPDQQKQVAAILDQAQGEYKAVHTAMDPQLEAVRQKTRYKIRAVLTDDQKPKFEEFLRQLDEQRKRNEQ
jgi:membrane protein YqaA with SNARE-associated domain